MTNKNPRTHICASFEYDCSIPLEIFAYICGFLSYRDILAFTQTCKYIRRLVRERYLKLHICLDETVPTLQQINPHDAFVRITKNIPHLDEFFSAYAPVMQELIVAANVPVPDLPALQKLTVTGKAIDRIPSAPNMHTCVATDSSVADISALVGCRNLQCLNIMRTLVKDISPLTQCANLRVLGIPAECMSTLPPRQCLPRLNTLNVWPNITITAAITLPDLPVSLKYLIINTIVADFGPIAQLTNLQKLHISGGPLTISMDFVKKLPMLRSCHIGDSFVTNLGGISACTKLNTLRLCDISADADMSALNACRNLQYVTINAVYAPDINMRLPNLLEFATAGETQSTRISGLQYSPLIISLSIPNTWIAHLPAGTWSRHLETLDISGSLITDISTLIVPALCELNIANTQIRDISVVAGCPALRKFNMTASYVEDIQPLAFCPELVDFIADGCKSLRTITVLSQLPHLLRVCVEACKIEQFAVISAVLMARGADVVV